MRKKIKAMPQESTDTLQTILRWGVYICILVPLIIFRDYLSPFHFGKVIVFRTLIEVLLIFYVLLLLKDRRFVPKRTPLFWLVTGFTAAFGFSAVLGINPYQSIVGTLERMGGWFTFLHFWVFYMIITSIMRTREDWMELLQVSVIGGAWAMLYAFLQKTEWDFIVGGGNRTRIFGTLGNTALFAGYAIINAFFALMLLFKQKIFSTERFFQLCLALTAPILISFIFVPDAEWILFFMLLGACVGILYGIYYALAASFGWPTSFVRFFNGMIALVSIIAIFMTAVRGSILGILVALGVAAVMYAMFGSSRGLRVAFFGGVTALIIIEGILISAHNSDFVQNSGYLKRISDVSLSTRTVNTRFWAWQAGIDGWNDSAKTIFLGWGPENFNVPFSVHFNPKFFTGVSSETMFDRAHNMFVEVLVTMGLVGFGLYIGIFIALFIGLAKIVKRASSTEDRLMAGALICGLIAYIIHNSFIFDTSANFIMFFALIGFIQHLISSQTATVPVTSPLPTSTTLRYSLAILLSAGVITLFSMTAVKPTKANYATTRAIVASWAGNHKLAVAKFREAIQYDAFPIYEIRHKYSQYVLENLGKFKESDGLNGGELLLESSKETEKNTVFKLDYLPHLYLARAYSILGKNNTNSEFHTLALAHASEALEISPTFVRSYYEVAQIYLNAEDYSNAIVMFQKAIDLNPEVRLSWWYLALAQLESGDYKTGFATVEKAVAIGYNYRNATDLGHLITAHEKVGNLLKVVELHEILVNDVDPKNPQYHAMLATAYVKINRIDDAVAQAKIAAELDSSFEAEARAFVAKLGRAW